MRLCRRQVRNYFQLVCMKVKVDALGHIQIKMHLYVPDDLLSYVTQTKVRLQNSDRKKQCQYFIHLKIFKHCYF